MENLLKDKPEPTGHVLEKVGYGEIVKDPQRITQSEGFQTALSEIGLRQALIAEGINPKKIAEKINVLLEATDVKGEIDFTAVDKGLKHATAIYGILPEEEKPKGNTYNFIFNADVQAEIKKSEEAIKAHLIQKHVQET